MSEGTVTEGKKIVMCSVTNCGNEIGYGHIVVHAGNDILCENCARRRKVTGSAVVYGGKPVEQANAIERDRAVRKLKKLHRMTKKTPQRQV